MDFVFNAIPDETSKEYSPSAVKAGAIVIDNSGAFRMDQTYPWSSPRLTLRTSSTTRASSPSPIAPPLRWSWLMAPAPVQPCQAHLRRHLSVRLRYRRAGSGRARQLTRQVHHVKEATRSLPAPDRLQPAHLDRLLEERWLHPRGDEAGKRDPQDHAPPYSLLPRPACECRSSFLTVLPSSPSWSCPMSPARSRVKSSGRSPGFVRFRTTRS